MTNREYPQLTWEGVFGPKLLTAEEEVLCNFIQPSLHRVVLVILYLDPSIEAEQRQFQFWMPILNSDLKCLMKPPIFHKERLLHGKYYYLDKKIL